MREFEYYEASKAKCPVCGSRNKVYTIFVDKVTNKHIGYSMKCCHCGGYKEFFNEHDSNGNSYSPKERTTKKTEKCIQHTFCPHKDCRLYGTSDINKVTIDDFIDKDDKNKYPCCQCKLEVQLCDAPKFL